MHVKCYEEIPLVKLVGGPSPLDGLVVLESDRHVCYDGFNIRAADLVCKELGFPAVKDFSAQTLSRAATLNRTLRLSCSYGSQHERVQDCPSKRTVCSWNKAVRLKCREPGFLGCYQGDRQTFQDLLDLVSNLNVHSDEECASTCRGKTGNHDIAVVHEEGCICYRSEEYANFISGVSYSHYWTPESKAEPEFGQQVYCLFNLSIGFCDHPGPVANGYWDSNITSFGSKITLTCGPGFVLTGSATLQCVGLPGWSAYFPAWNASVPCCGAVENATDDEWHVAKISTTPSQTDFTLSKRQSTKEFTTLQETIMTTSSVSGDLEMDITAHILGTLLCIVLILLVILSVAWWNHQKKSDRRMPSQPSNQLNDRQLQMYPVDTSNQSPSSTDHVVLNTAGTEVRAEGHPFPNHPCNIFRNVTIHQEDPYHVYQDAVEVQKMASQPSSVEQIPPCAISAQNNDTTPVSTLLTSRNMSQIQTFNGQQETSLGQTENSYEDCDYQDVDLGRNDWVTESAFRSHGGARLFDDRCYNSLNFAKRSGGVCTPKQDASITHVDNGNEELESEYAQSYKHDDFAKSRDMLIDNDYDHINSAFHDDPARSHNPTLPFIFQTSQSKDHSNSKGNIPFTNTGSRIGTPSEDVLYYQLEQGKPKEIVKSPVCHDAFDSSDYSLLNPEDSDEVLLDERGFGSLNARRDTKEPINEEPVMCEELYAKVDKTREACNNDVTTALHEEMYAQVNKTTEPSPSAKPVLSEGLYAEVDKTRESCIADTKSPSHEEMYMNITQIQMS